MASNQTERDDMLQVASRLINLILEHGMERIDLALAYFDGVETSEIKSIVERMSE